MDKLILEGQKIDISVVIEEKDSCFRELKDRFNAHARTLASLIPSV